MSKKVKHRLKIHNGYLCLCDEDGKVIPRQTSCTIESKTEEPMRVTMTCWVMPDEIHPDLLRERTYRIVEDKKEKVEWMDEEQ